MDNKEIDQLVLSPSLYQRALDVSRLLSLLLVVTSITYDKDINTANICHDRGTRLLIVSLALTSFAMLNPVAKMGQVSVYCGRQLLSCESR